MAQKVHEIITDKIIKQLEAGTIPWRKPWGTCGNGGLPRNGVTQRPYSGVNLLMLEWGESYYTWNQIQDKKWKVKKGSKASMVVFFTLVDKKGKQETEKEDKIPIMRYYNVFASSDIEGAPTTQKEYVHDPIKEAEEIVSNYKEVPIHHHNNNRAFYSPSEDYINVPEYNKFAIPEEYYNTLFHEMSHSTGHSTRLKRFVGAAATASFGSKLYSLEELVAELGAAFLCGHCGIEQTTLENSTAYIANWLKVLKDDKTIIVKAAAKASKSTDYIIGVEN